jgi:hypothetical protein
VAVGVSVDGGVGVDAKALVEVGDGLCARAVLKEHARLANRINAITEIISTLLFLFFNFNPSLHFSIAH